MSIETHSTHMDVIRPMLVLAVQCGHKRKNRETGFIHYSYEEKVNDEGHVIPIVENFLYALALLRTRVMENMQEAKDLLEKLLYFQHMEETAFKGNFPVYLHEYPMCKHPCLAARILPIIYWILKDYKNILGEKLRLRLEESLMMLVSYCLSYYEKDSSSYSFAVTIASAVRAVGSLLNKSKWKDNTLLDELAKEYYEKPIYSPRFLSDLFIALQMLYESFEKTPWESFWRDVSLTWNFQTASYGGLPIKEYQRGFEPEVTYYDIFFGNLLEKWSQRVFVDNIVQLQLAFLRPFFPLPVENQKRCGISTHFSEKEKFSTSVLDRNSCFITEGSLGSHRFCSVGGKHYCFSLIQHQGNLPPDKGYHVFRMSWGSRERLHSLICPKGRYHLNFEIKENGVDLFFTLPEDIDLENKKHCREVAFYSDLCENDRWRVCDNVATTFQLGEQLSRKQSFCTPSLKFILDFGEGSFFGHLTRGNRPSQVSCKGYNHSNVFDSMIFLRTLCRSKKCCIKVEVRLKQ